MPRQINTKRMKEPKACSYNSIPDDLIPNILCKLPIKSLCRFKCVTKSWCSLIQQPVFISDLRKKTSFVWEFLSQYQLELYSIDDNGLARFIRKKHWCGLISTVRHCDGLMVREYVFFDKVSVFNLATNTDRILPTLPPDYRNFFGIVFGTDPVSKKHKLLYRGKSDFYILTLQEDSSWRRVERPPGFGWFIGFGVTAYETLSVTVNGTLFTVENKDSPRIISFNLTTEEFGTIRPPESVLVGGSYEYSLFECEGSLCLVKQAGMNDLEIEGLWMLTNVEKNVWVMIMKNVTLSMTLEGTPIVGSDILFSRTYFWARSGEILIATYSAKARYLFSYSLLNRQFTRKEVIGIPLSTTQSKQSCWELIG